MSQVTLSGSVEDPNRNTIDFTSSVTHVTSGAIAAGDRKLVFSGGGNEWHDVGANDPIVGMQADDTALRGHPHNVMAIVRHSDTTT